MASYSGPKSTTNNLVFHLDSGNEKSYPGSGTVWRDLSGRENNGSLVNGVIFSRNNLGYMSFNGSNLVSVGSPTGYLTNLGTLMCWIYPNSSNSNTFFQQYSNDLNRMSLTHGSNAVSVYSGYSTTNLSFASAASSVPASRWTHIGYTFDFSGNSFSLYVNGNLSSTVVDTDVPDIGTTGEITLGCAKDFDIAAPHYFNFYNGRIANFISHNIVLSGDEILQNFDATKGRFGF